MSILEKLTEKELLKILTDVRTQVENEQSLEVTSVVEEIEQKLRKYELSN